jgi:chromosome segregation ATPase
MKANDTYLDEFREATNTTIAPKKHLGFYLAKEVDGLIVDMKSQQENLQALFQERFEEQRMSLLATSRDRDDVKKKAQDLETELEKARDWRTILSEKGMIALEVEKANQFHEKSIKYDSAVEENKKISERLEIAERELSVISRVNADYEHLQDLVARQSKDLAEAHSRNKSFSVALQEQKDKAAQKAADLTEVIEQKDQSIKAREKDTRMLVERYENALSTHSDSLKSLTVSFDEYALSVNILSESILGKHTHFIPDAQPSQYSD